MQSWFPVTYLGHLRDQYTCLGAQTLVPKKRFSSFLFHFYFNKKYAALGINDLTMHLIVLKCLRWQKRLTKEKKNETRRGRSERRNILQKCFHSYKYIIDHANVNFFFKVNCLHCFVWILLRLFCSSLKFIAIQISHLNTIWIYEFFKNHPQRGVFHNINLSNLEDALQRNIYTGRVRMCIFRACGGTNFENCPVQQQPWRRLNGFDVRTGLTKKSSGYVRTICIVIVYLNAW